MERDTAMFLLGALAGLVGNIAVALWLEWVRRPKFEFVISTPDTQEHSETKPAKKAHFLHISITNKRIAKISRYVERNHALGCVVQLEYIDIHGRNPLKPLVHLEGRWISAPEFNPVPVIATNKDLMGYILPYDDRMRQQRVDIGAGSSEAVTVAARFDSDQDCYAFSNKSYFSDPQWRNPEFKLGRGIFFVRVEVQASGIPGTVRAFRIQNDGDVEHFQLFEIDVTEFEIRKRIANGRVLPRLNCQCGCGCGHN